MSDGIVVGIDASRPVARGHHVASALELLLAPAEMMGERLEIFYDLLPDIRTLHLHDHRTSIAQGGAVHLTQ